jgi:hypothetical protein
MLPLKPKNSKKIEIYLSLRQPKHPWDEAAEKAKAKRQEQKIHQNLADQVLIEPRLIQPKLHRVKQKIEQQQTFEAEEELLENEDSNEGFYLCPTCTCWFTHKKDLNYHLKNWCEH